MEPISTPIVVLGMHRSGTSALTGMLHSLGIHLGPEEDLKSPQKDNPQGPVSAGGRTGTLGNL